MNNWHRTISLVFAAVATVGMCAVPLRAAEPGVEAEGWVTRDAEGGATFQESDQGYMSVVFPAKSSSSVPTYSVGSLIADTRVSQGALVGDYVSAGANRVRFRVMGTGTQPGHAVLLMKSGSGRKWYNKRVTVSPEAGIWTTNAVDMTVAAGWETPGGAQTESLLAQDLAGVTELGIRFSQQGVVYQAFSVDDFELVVAVLLTDLQQALETRFGVTSINGLTPADLAADTDGDGMPDYIEILLELDLQYRKGMFAAQMVAVDEDGIVIRWPCVVNHKYSLFRAGNLFVPFALLDGAADMQAVDTGFMSYKDLTATGSGPYYYKVKERP